jgi:hypothetical protein
MICPKCHGNGYWIEKLKVLRQVRQCETCNSQGEIEKPMSLKKYSYAFDLAFEVISSESDWGNISAKELKSALLKRIKQLDEDSEWLEACSSFDSYELDERRKVG